MSRGLGKLQKTILDTLQAAKESELHYRGSDQHHAPRPGWVTFDHGGGCYIDIELAEDVFDMRASLRHVARLCHGFSHANFLSPIFMAAFSRAAKKLASRGLLTFPRMVPTKNVVVMDTEPVGLHYLSDGIYFKAKKTRRFAVRVKKERLTLNP